jgi:hypothetical protein
MISVYKTSVEEPAEIRPLIPFLDQFGKWNFDLDDCDKILRIESDIPVANSVISLLSAKGFVCEEL